VRDMTDQSDEHGFDLLEMQSALARAPHPTYQALLAGSRVLHVDGVGVIVSSRSAVEHILRSPEDFSSNFSSGLGDLKNRRPLIPLQTDPPDHRKYRRLLDPLFAPQRMAAYEAPTTALANELIDAFVDDAEIDFSQQFSVPLPSQVFLTMLGLPRDELPHFLAMKDGVIRPDQVAGEPRGNPKTEELQQATADSIYVYFEELLAERAQQPRDDLVTTFLNAEVEGDRLSHEEILDICFLFLIAGLDTVTASLDCFFGYFGSNDEARRHVVEHPDAIPAIIEEMLRWETPVMAVSRVAMREMELEGCPVAKGEPVMALIGAANIDAEDATDLRFDRDVNRHLAFGGGIHRCLGSHLARLELRVALREWHRRIPEYRVKPGADLEYTPGIRTLEHFPMLLGSPSA
jgi:cytochrome P450